MTAMTRKIRNLSMQIRQKFTDIYFAFNLISILKQGVQELKAFAFCVITVNDKRTEPRFKRKRAG